jgi:hypothetical protein
VDRVDDLQSKPTGRNGNLLQDSNGQKPRAAQPKGVTLPVPVFPQYPEKLNDPGPERPPEGNRNEVARRF